MSLGHVPDKLQLKLREEGGIRALLGMVRSRHPDVLAQVARGIANFAKCESRGAAQGEFTLPMYCSRMNFTFTSYLHICVHAQPLTQKSGKFHRFSNVDGWHEDVSVGYKLGRSLLIDDGALPWIVANANNDASPIRRHIELALCHLAQHGMELCFCFFILSIFIISSYSKGGS